MVLSILCLSLLISFRIMMSLGLCRCVLGFLEVIVILIMVSLWVMFFCSVVNILVDRKFGF